jgi:hypothetical protein
VGVGYICGVLRPDAQDEGLMVTCLGFEGSGLMITISRLRVDGLEFRVWA